jgi:ribonuclease-3
LQEHLQSAHAGVPVYRLKSESGPDHRKRFHVEVRLTVSHGEPGKLLARGMGSTKKQAEQDAARRALERLVATAAKAAALASNTGEPAPGPAQGPAIREEDQSPS